MAEEKRFQVFVSSTYLDLADERRAVVETLLELDAFPAGMELFPATDDDAWTLIESVIEDSDYYLLIVGGKYGSIDPDLDVSYTEREYDTAVRFGKPVMAFLHGKPDQLTAKPTPIDGPSWRLSALRWSQRSTSNTGPVPRILRERLRGPGYSSSSATPPLDGFGRIKHPVATLWRHLLVPARRSSS